MKKLIKKEIGLIAGGKIAPYKPTKDELINSCVAVKTGELQKRLDDCYKLGIEQDICLGISRQLDSCSKLSASELKLVNERCMLRRF